MSGKWAYLVKLPSDKSATVDSDDLSLLNEVVDLINKATREAGVDTFENKK